MAMFDDWSLDEIIMGTKADLRLNNWPLMSSSFGVLTIVSMYWLFCGFIGPKLMDGKERFQVLDLLTSYNEGLGVLNGALAYECLICVAAGSYSLGCESMKYNDQLKTNDVYSALLTWVFFIFKVVELGDTIFMILLKRKISIMHLYHHSSMVIIGWLGARYAPGGTTIIFELINYVAQLAAFIYWKIGMHTDCHKSLSYVRFNLINQLIEFALIQLVCICVKRTECGYPVWAANCVGYYIQSYVFILMGPWICGLEFPAESCTRICLKICPRPRDSPPPTPPPSGSPRGPKGPSNSPKRPSDLSKGPSKSPRGDPENSPKGPSRDEYVISPEAYDLRTFTPPINDDPEASTSTRLLSCSAGQGERQSMQIFKPIPRLTNINKDHEGEVLCQSNSFSQGSNLLDEDHRDEATGSVRQSNSTSQGSNLLDEDHRDEATGSVRQSNSTSQGNNLADLSVGFLESDPVETATLSHWVSQHNAPIEIGPLTRSAARRKTEFLQMNQQL